MTEKNAGGKRTFLGKLRPEIPPSSTEVIRNLLLLTVPASRPARGRLEQTSSCRQPPRDFLHQVQLGYAALNRLDLQNGTSCPRLPPPSGSKCSAFSPRCEVSLVTRFRRGTAQAAWDGRASFILRARGAPAFPNPPAAAAQNKRVSVPGLVCGLDPAPVSRRQEGMTQK